jgi:hypothetical protein
MNAQSAIFEEGWSPRRVALLREHHAFGLSAARSAELIGGVSRNAVISKRHRLGLISVRRAAETPCVKVRSADRLAGFHRPPLMRCEPLPNMDFALPADAMPKRLTERRVGECVWPIGDAEAEGDYLTLFCCAPVAARSSYCFSHAAVAKGRL